MLFSKYRVQRNLPKNFEKKDLSIFKHELDRKFKSIFLINRKNVLINNYKFYLLSYFQFGSKFWRMVELTSLQKFKEFIKNSLSLFEINNEKKKQLLLKKHRG